MLGGGVDRRADAGVRGADDADARVARGGVLGDVGGRVGRAVVPDEQLEVAIRLPQHAADGGGDEAARGCRRG